MFSSVDKKGFSAIELMVAVAIIAVTAALAAPDIIEWGSNQRLKSASRDVLSNLQKARIEAVKRNTNQVVISFTAGVYDPAGEVGSYRIFVDNGAGGGTAGNFVRDGTESILVQETMPRNVSLYSANFGGLPVTIFSPNGLPNASGTVDMRNNKSNYFRAFLSPAGNLRLQRSRDGATWN